jgi:hypothetical protein
VIISPLTGRAATQEVEFVHWGQIQEFLKFEALMQAMGLSIHCHTCFKALGPPNDGVQMRINDKDRTVTITCAHRERRLKVEKHEQMKVLLSA